MVGQNESNVTASLSSSDKTELCLNFRDYACQSWTYRCCDIYAPRGSIAVTIIRQWRRYEVAFQSMFFTV